MESEKISISLDEVNSERVDAEIHRQDIAARMAAHQEQVEANTPSTRRFRGAGFFRKAVAYMAVFGLAASIIGWGLGEIVMYKVNHHPWYQLRQSIEFYNVFSTNNPRAGDREWLDALENLHKSGNTELSGNPYLQRSFWTQSKWEIEKELERVKDMEGAYKCLHNWYYVLIGLLIGLGLAMAEPIVGHNGTSAIVRGLVGVGLGALGGFFCSLFIDKLYNALGAVGSGISFKQLFARSVAWCILGVFLAIAPGIVMRNWKKFLLGLAGGAIGGLIGGILFDPICELTGSDIPARFVNIVGLGVGAAVATALLEEVAKQGWLKVATGVITGKQFILYRNPTVIGSSPKTEIYLFKDPTVSPKHAAINGIGGEFLLTALNGAIVYINGRPVQQQRLRNGDQIRVGNTIFLFGSRALKNN